MDPGLTMDLEVTMEDLITIMVDLTMVAITVGDITDTEEVIMDMVVGTMDMEGAMGVMGISDEWKRERKRVRTGVTE